MELIMANEGNIQLFPRSNIYRNNFEGVKWNDNSRVEKAKEKEFTGTSEDFFRASDEDIERLKDAIGRRCDYAERVRENWGKISKG